MRLAAISDIHANAIAFEAVIADIRKQSPDAIVCLGDVVMRGPQPQECVEMLRSLKPLITVRGNFDNRLPRRPESHRPPQTPKEELLRRDLDYTCARLAQHDQEWLGNLPLGFATAFDGAGVELYHAAPDSLVRYTWPWATVDELARLRAESTTQVVLFGHMHHPFVRSAQGTAVVNTGSIGLSFDDDNRASYAIIDLDHGQIATQIRRVPYDVEAAVRIAVDLGMPDADLFAQAVRHATFPYPAN